MRYYISDLHFYHKNMLNKLDCRNFKNIEEMNKFMIKQWNEKVKKNDEVVVLGDFSFGNYNDTLKIINQLNGKIFLIKGNHDHHFLNEKKPISKIQWVKDYAEMRDNGRKVILSHYPIIFYNGQYNLSNGNAITYMLHGHVHDSYDQKLLDEFVTKIRKSNNGRQNIPANIINCFCMYSNFTPLSLDEWVQLNKKRRCKNV